MAMTEIQLPTKDNFYRAVQAAATELDNIMLRLGNFSEFIGRMDVSDLNAIGVPQGQTRTDLTNLRTAINEIVAFYNGTSTAQTVVPADATEELRRLA